MSEKKELNKEEIKNVTGGKNENGEVNIETNINDDKQNDGYRILASDTKPFDGLNDKQLSDVNGGQVDPKNLRPRNYEPSPITKGGAVYNEGTED